MNLIYFIIMGIVGLLTVPVYTLPGGNIANKYFLEKQKFLFEIVQHIQDPLQNLEWINVSQTLIMDKTKYIEFNNLMDQFYIKSKSNNLLPMNTNFYITDIKQLDELKGLYYFLYNAQDFETLRGNICWARSHVNPEMFIFALTQALMKREDFKDLNLPKIYEIWPQHFLTEKFIRKFQSFNYAKWSKEETFHQQHCKNKCCREYEQFRVYEERDRMIFPKDIYENLRNSSKWLEALEDVSLYWLPIDFNTDTVNFRAERERENTHLLEDKDWNSYWYYINMGLWLNQAQGELYSKDLRDWWFWNLQQIVARYKMDLHNIKYKSKSISNMIDFQGIKYRTLDSKQRLHVWNWLKDLIHTTETALYEQTYQINHKTKLQLNNPEQFELFLNENFNVEKMLNILMSLQNNQKFPTLLQQYETMLRSDEFYKYAEIIVNLYKSLKSQFQPYKPKDLEGGGLTLNNVEITELKTFFEITDMDVSNLLRSSNIYFEGKLLWYKTLLARQQTLQHQPFTLWFNVTSEKPQAIAVRTFLVGECLPQESYCSTDSSFLQLDIFVSNLALGYNIIERQSKDLYGYAFPSLTYTELYHLTHLGLNDEYEFPLNITTGNCKFPHHLLLPRGEKDGFPMKFVFVITPYNYHFHKAFNLNCDFTGGILKFDNLANGFPFDREISENVFMTDNILVKKVKIYHDENVKLV